MKSNHIPALGPRYWAALVGASALGTNTGDFAARDLGLGHAGGLAPLLLLFGAILVAERRAARRTELFYWAAIVTLRTAATNIADFATHDLRLSEPLVVLAFALLLLALVLTDRDAFVRRGFGSAEVPVVDRRYWLVMLVAGILGTALGDLVADVLDPGPAALLTLPAFALLLGARRASGWRTKASYWLVVAAVRTAGTNVGDWLAEPDGLHLGLPASTALTAATFAAILILWRPRSSHALDRAIGGSPT